MKKQVIQQESDIQSESSEKMTRQKIPKIMDIKIVFEQPSQTGTKQTTQLIEQFPISQHVDSSFNLNLKSMMYDLTANYNISFQNKQIHYYLHDQELYMNCGIEPISEDIKIHSRDWLENSEGIKIKVKKMKNIMILHKLMAVQNPILNDEEKQKQIKEQASKSRRTKQRRIGYIIQKVIEWRQFYHGNDLAGHHPQKLSLQQAAQKVNISKKSLDDYLFQIRFGKKYNFNFNEHYNDKVGVLRDFVRSKKKADKQMIKNRNTQLMKEEQ